jgi:disulfide bond formation protein DsbB
MSPLFAVGVLLLVGVTLAAVVGVELRPAHRLRLLVDDHGQKLAFAIAAAAMAASLYYSESVGFLPCEFCWYQRIAMYPLAVLLLVGLVTRDRLGLRYTAVIAAIGLGLAIYHYQMQLFPEQATQCAGGVSCTAKYVDEFGFISIPFMAGSSFLAILLVHLAMWRSRLHLEYPDET